MKSMILSRKFRELEVIEFDIPKTKIRCEKKIDIGGQGDNIFLREH